AVPQRGRDEDGAAGARPLGFSQDDVPLLRTLFAGSAERGDLDLGPIGVARTDVPRDELGAVAEPVIRRARLDRAEVERAVGVARELTAGEARELAHVRPDAAALIDVIRGEPLWRRDLAGRDAGVRGEVADDVADALVDVRRAEPRRRERRRARERL